MPSFGPRKLPAHKMKIPLIQFNATPNKSRNLQRSLQLTLRAIRNKARFILLPEVFNYRGSADPKSGYHSAAEFIPGESVIPFMNIARAHSVFILIGSLYEKVKGKTKVYNASVLINGKGQIQAKYRKIHLFNAHIGRKTINESKFLMAGQTVKTTSAQGFKIGMSVCYDLRFPEMYQKYQRARVDIITVPSSFT